MSWGEWLEMWLGAALTLMIFSFLYRDNPFYKFAEHLFVGVSAAYWMVQGFWNTLMPNLIGRLYPPLVGFAYPSLVDREPNFVRLIPLLFGIFLLMRLIPPVSQYARMAMGLAIGFAAGTNLTRYLQSDFVSQIGHTMEPLVVTGNNGFSLGGTLSSVVMVAGVLAGLVYFFFSKEHAGITGRVSRFGIYVLMISFGAAFGYTVMARISLLTGRFEFLIDWFQNIGTFPS